MFLPLIAVSPRRAMLFCVLLAIFELLTYAGSDVVMPGMLQVTSELGVDPHYVPLTLNIYLMGGVALQWMIGPLSDHYGRRPLLLLGCCCFAMAFAATIWADNITQFIFLRFVQGFGLGFVVVVSYPAMQEIYPEKDAVRMLAILANIALISPLLGPLFGGLLLSVLSWRELFAAIAVISALVWIGLWRFMPETVGVVRQDGSRIAPQPLSCRSIAAGYGALLRNRIFIVGCLALGLVGLPLIAWIALSPLLLMHNLDHDAMSYGLWQLPIFGGLISGNVLLGRYVERFTLFSLTRLAMIPLFGGLLFALIATFITGELWALAAGLSLFALGLGICNATLYRQTLYATEGGKGGASALIGMISVAIYGLGSSVLAQAGAGASLFHFIAFMSLPALLAVIPLYWLFRCSRQPISPVTTD